MSTNLKMHGELEPGLLMDMLQVMNRRRNLNGYVEVSDSSVAGRIWLQEGAVIAANWKDRQGELAVESMLRLKQGVFEIGEAAVLPTRTIFKDTVALLMMCMRAIGREALNPEVPLQKPQVRQADHGFYGSIPGKLADVADEQMPVPAHLHEDRRRGRGLVMTRRSTGFRVQKSEY